MRQLYTYNPFFLTHVTAIPGFVTTINDQTQQRSEIPVSDVYNKHSYFSYRRAKKTSQWYDEW